MLAREAVVGFLRDADGISAAEGPLPSEAAITASRLTAESAAWRAAELSVAALDRIEATVASVEADICAALQAQTDLQAGAGEAVEAAVRAAQVAWVAAGTAVEAHKGATAALRKVEHYVSLTILLTVIAIIILAVGGIPLH